MKITKIIIEKEANGKWSLKFDNGMPVIEYGKLLKLATALMKFAKGQGL